MYKIAVIGDQDTVLAFEAFGIKSIVCQTGQEAARAIRHNADECAIIFVTEQLAQAIPAEIAKYQEKITPAIILIPSRSGSLGIGVEAISKAVEKAVGVNIFEIGAEEKKASSNAERMDN